MNEFTLLVVSIVFYGISLGASFLTLPIASWTLWLGLAFHVGTVVARGIGAGHFPVASFYESLIFISLTTAVIFAAVAPGVSIRSFQVGGRLLIFLALAAALAIDRSAEPLVPALRSIWIKIHVPVMMTSYGAFAVAAISSILDLTARDSGIHLTMERLTSKLIAFGFIFLTLGIGLGAIWAHEAWGTYWGWDPKETWALITWLIYAIYLHGKYVTGWKGRRLAWVSVIGFGAVVFTYVGVSFLLSGLHSYI